MKRLLILLPAMIMTLSLAACGGAVQPGEGTTPSQTSQAPQSSAPASSRPSTTPEDTPDLPGNPQKSTAEDYFSVLIQTALSEIEKSDVDIEPQDFASDDTKVSFNLAGIQTAIDISFTEAPDTPILESIRFVTTDEDFWYGDGPFLAIRLVCEDYDEAVAVFLAMGQVETDKDRVKYDWPMHYKGYAFKDEQDTVMGVKAFFLEIAKTDEPDTFSIDGGLLPKK